MTTNGNGSIHVLGSGRPLGRDNDYITVGQARRLIAEETSKVHEYYLNQIPTFVARMIQDALLSYGLIKLDAENALTPAEAPVVSENAAQEEPPNAG